jgi:2-succinyl-5-enolpyruvyl-6-hydroxy-3-cyclohexene-1-carboxylate synthase
MEAHWVLAEPQRKQTLAAAVAVIAAAMPVANPVSQMLAVLMGIRVVVVAQAGQRPTLYLQRTRKASAQETVCSPLLPRKPQQFPRQ